MGDRTGLNRPDTKRLLADHVLYSRTDSRGVIKIENCASRVVGGYSGDEMVGKPHNVMRQPEMPRAVFELIWSELKAKRAVGAYIQNRAADDEPYWVFAVIAPVPEGYVSARIKPQSNLLEQIKPIYSAIKKTETKDGLEPTKSAALLLKHISALGYDDYAHFMSDALIRESQARAESLGRSPNKMLSVLTEIVASVERIGEYGNEVSRLFAQTEQIPYNMRLQAGRLEGSDGPISVISENHRLMAGTLTASVGDFREAAALGAGPLRTAKFENAAGALVTDVLLTFNDDDVLGKRETESECKKLGALREDFAKRTRDAVKTISSRVHEFARMCRDMRRMLSGLELTRIMCKIERVKVKGPTEGLDEIVHRLSIAERDLSKAMSKIEDEIQTILDACEAMMAQQAEERSRAKVA